MMLASWLSDWWVVAITLATMRAVRSPSPEGSPGRMMWPDCSPPSSIWCSRMAAAT